MILYGMSVLYRYVYPLGVLYTCTYHTVWSYADTMILWIPPGGMRYTPTPYPYAMYPYPLGVYYPLPIHHVPYMYMYIHVLHTYTMYAYAYSM